MCCFKEKVSAPKRPKDSKAWCPLSFSFEMLLPQWEYNTITRRIENQRIIRKVKH